MHCNQKTLVRPTKCAKRFLSYLLQPKLPPIIFPVSSSCSTATNLHNFFFRICLLNLLQGMGFFIYRFKAALFLLIYHHKCISQSTFTTTFLTFPLVTFFTRRTRIDSVTIVRSVYAGTHHSVKNLYLSLTDFPFDSSKR